MSNLSSTRNISPTNADSPISARERALSGRDPELLNNTDINQIACTPCSMREASPCCIEALIVRCDHEQRSYYLRAPDMPVTHEGRRVIQVLATSSKPDVIRIAIEGGPCFMGRPSVCGDGKVVSDNYVDIDSFPAAVISGPQVNVTAATPVRIKAYGPPAGFVTDLKSLWNFILDHETCSPRHTVRVRCCSGGEDLEIDVVAIPAYSVSYTLSLGFTSQPAATKGGDPITGFTITSSGNIRYGETNVSLNAPDLLPTIQSVLRFLLEFLVGISDDSSRAGASPMSAKKVGFTLVPPNIQLKFQKTLSESRHDWDIVYESSVRFSFSPLIGTKIKIDILAHLIRLAGRASTPFGGPAGPIIAEILIKVRDRLGADQSIDPSTGQLNDRKLRMDVRIDFEMTGSIEGSFNWIRNKSLSNWTSSDAGLDAGIGLKLVGSGSAEFRTMMLSAGAVLSATAKSKFGAKLIHTVVGRHPGLQGKIYFDGIKINWMCVTDFALGDIAKAPPSADSKKMPKTSLDKPMLSAGPDDEASWVLVKASSFPEDPKAPFDISRGDF